VLSQDCHNTKKKELVGNYRNAGTGWVSLGITHDTAAFAVASIRT
jgi:hypothetical protein